MKKEKLDQPEFGRGNYNRSKRKRSQLSILIFLPIVLVTCSLNGPGFQFSLFDGTELEELAVAVEREDTAAFEKIFAKCDCDIDFAEPQFGKTLLMLSVMNGLNKSATKLLRMGADPNKRDLSDATPLIMACDKTYYGDCNVALIKMMIDYGGNVNTIQNKPQPKHVIHRSLLMVSVGQLLPCFEETKFLIEQGADINATVNNDPSNCAVNSALMLGNLEAASYMLLEKGALVPDFVLLRLDSRTEKFTDTVTVVEYLEENQYSRFPEKEQLRINLLKNLKDRGYE